MSEAAEMQSQDIDEAYVNPTPTNNTRKDGQDKITEEGRGNQRKPRTSEIKPELQGAFFMTSSQIHTVMKGIALHCRIHMIQRWRLLVTLQLLTLTGNKATKLP